MDNPKEEEILEIKTDVKKVHSLTEKVIILSEQADGNWKGWMNKGGKIIEKRQYDPNIVLQLLLTSDGK